MAEVYMNNLAVCIALHILDMLLCRATATGQRMGTRQQRTHALMNAAFCNCFMDHSEMPQKYKKINALSMQLSLHCFKDYLSALGNASNSLTRMVIFSFTYRFHGSQVYYSYTQLWHFVCHFLGHAVIQMDMALHLMSSL